MIRLEFSNEELGIIEIALANDIKDQKEFLDKNGNDIMLNEYLRKSNILYSKILMTFNEW